MSNCATGCIRWVQCATYAPKEAEVAMVWIWQCRYLVVGFEDDSCVDIITLLGCQLLCCEWMCINNLCAEMRESCFAGDFWNDKSQPKWPLLASQVEPYTATNGEVATEDGELLWSGLWWARPMDTRKKIFCNRSLNMKSIEAIGFDMDYTLAQYKADTFESLAYAGTIKKLVHDLNYPAEVSFFLPGLFQSTVVV